MQKTSPMHLNTSPTSFEGSGTGKHEKIHNTLKNLKLAPKKLARFVFDFVHNSRGNSMKLRSGADYESPGVWRPEMYKTRNTKRKNNVAELRTSRCATMCVPFAFQV